jgi:hypothetical protein
MMSKREYDPNESVDFIYKTAPKYAAAKSQRVYLEEFRKSKKALLMKSCGESSIAAQEREAYAHPEYQELIAGIRVATEEEEVLRWSMVAAQARLDIWRTQSANNRGMDRATQ